MSQGEPEEHEEEDIIEELPPAVQRRVNALKNIHKEHLNLEKKYREEVALLDLKYDKLYAPLYLKQSAIVQGEYEPTDAETHLEGEEAAPSNKIDEDITGIPKFWLTILKNNSAIGETITENDEDALSYLKDIKCTHFEDQKGFEITFYFAENPYFTETTLSKKYYLVDDDNIYGELVFDRAEGSTINWKQGKNLTIKLIKKQQKAKGGKGKKPGASRVSVVEEPCDSFFHFFSAPKVDEEDEEEEGALASLLEQDFEIGCIIKDKLIPHAVLWFTGEALEFEDDYDDYEDYFDEEGEEGEEDEEEEEEEEKPRKKSGKRADTGKPFQLQPPTHHNNGPAQPQQPECKQQ